MSINRSISPAKRIFRKKCQSDKQRYIYVHILELRVMRVDPGIDDIDETERLLDGIIIEKSQTSNTDLSMMLSFFVAQMKIMCDGNDTADSHALQIFLLMFKPIGMSQDSYFHGEDSAISESLLSVCKLMNSSTDSTIHHNDLQGFCNILQRMKNISLFRSAFSVGDATQNKDTIRRDLFFLFRYKYYITYWKNLCKTENHKNATDINAQVYLFLNIFRKFEKSPFVPEKPKDEYVLHIRIMDLIQSIVSGKNRTKHGKFTQQMKIHVLRMTERLLYFMNLNKIDNVDMSQAQVELIEHEKRYDYPFKPVTRLTAFLANPRKLAPEHRISLSFDTMRIDDTESDSPAADDTESDSIADDVTESDSSEEDVPSASTKRSFGAMSQSQMRKKSKLESDIKMSLTHRNMQ